MYPPAPPKSIQTPVRSAPSRVTIPSSSRPALLARAALASGRHLYGTDAGAEGRDLCPCDGLLALEPRAALTLPRRPFLHCSTVIPVVVMTLKFTMHLFKLKDSWCFLPWMLFMSWTSHHIRDGIRHGLWICPFGKTSPLPFWLYVVMTSSLPHICSLVMYLTGTRQMMSSKHGIHIDV